MTRYDILKFICLALIFLVAGIVILNIAKLIFSCIRKKNNAIHIYYLHRIFNVLVVAILIYAFSQQFDTAKEISKTLLQSGSLIIAIATFAAQQSLGNLISGFSISMTKPFAIGQKIKVEVNGMVVAEGIVKDITLRHTTIRQFDGQTCIVPNSTMDNAVIVDTAYDGEVGNFIEVTVSFDSDVEKAIELVQNICISEPLTLNNENDRTLVKGMNENGAVLKTTVWTKDIDDNFLACSNIRKKIIEEFRENNIVLANWTVSST